MAQELEGVVAYAWAFGGADDALRAKADAFIARALSEKRCENPMDILSPRVS